MSYSGPATQCVCSVQRVNKLNFIIIVVIVIITAIITVIITAIIIISVHRSLCEYRRLTSF